MFTPAYSSEWHLQAVVEFDLSAGYSAKQDEAHRFLSTMF